MLEVYDAGGTLLAFDDDGGPGLTPLLNFVPPMTGTYYANVRAFDAGATGYVRGEGAGLIRHHSVIEIVLRLTNSRMPSRDSSRP